jgi:SAM-dependent methyltransferase
MTAPDHPGGPYFRDVAERLGEAYLRYSFTKGTQQEVAFLIEVLGLRPGQRLLDVGCGPGRHSVALAQAGLAVTGIDISARFLEIAAAAARTAGVGAAFFEVDARSMPFDDEFDAVISICQGAFGLMGEGDGLVLRRIAEAARPDGLVCVTAFSAYYEASNPRREATFDADKGIVHEHSSIRDESGAEHNVDLWTGVYTPRELRLLALGTGLVPEAVYSVGPGEFARRRPGFEHPEFMLIARKPARP